VTVHLYRAPFRSALRYRVELGDGRGITIRNPRRRPIRTVCCRKRRIAANLNVQVYYDGCYFSCKPGTGCRTS